MAYQKILILIKNGEFKRQDNKTEGTEGNLLWTVKMKLKSKENGQESGLKVQKAVFKTNNTLPKIAF